MADIEVDEIPRPEVIFKVIVVGNADVGKSALIRRFVFDSFTPLKSTAPVGVGHKEDVLVKLREPFATEDMIGRLHIWDLENPHEIEPILDRRIIVNWTGVVYCYDVNDRQSFLDVQHWMRTVERLSTKVASVLVGLQCDRKPSKRQVLLSEAKTFASRCGLRFNRTTSLPYPHFHEASSKTGFNVESVIMGLVYKMMKLSIELAPRSDKYNVARALREVSATQSVEEEEWLKRQTRKQAPIAPSPAPPVTETWPDTPIALHCCDVAKMTLAEFTWCLNKNHWDADLAHIPAGWPQPPLQEPVWWWPGWGSRWGRLPKPLNRAKYVDCWFVRGKQRAREEFLPFFGTVESEMAEEFSKQSGAGSAGLSLADAIRLEEAAISSAQDSQTLEPLFIPPSSVTSEMFLDSFSEASTLSRNRRK